MTGSIRHTWKPAFGRQPLLGSDAGGYRCTKDNRWFDNRTCFANSCCLLSSGTIAGGADEQSMSIADE